MNAKKLDAKIAEVEAFLTKLKTLRESIDDPALRELLNDEPSAPKVERRRLQTPTPPAASTPPSNGKNPRLNQTYEKIRAFLMSRSNQPATATEIRKATGLSRSYVSATLYVKRKHNFVRVMQQEGEVPKWRLAEVSKN